MMCASTASMASTASTDSMGVDVVQYATPSMDDEPDEGNFDDSDYLDPDDEVGF